VTPIDPNVKSGEKDAELIILELLNVNWETYLLENNQTWYNIRLWVLSQLMQSPLQSHWEGLQILKFLKLLGKGYCSRNNPLNNVGLSYADCVVTSWSAEGEHIAMAYRACKWYWSGLSSKRVFSGIKNRIKSSIVIKSDPGELINTKSIFLFIDNLV
jgi:hypothetical protein